MITCRVETFTPDDASKALERCTHQRPLSRATVARLETDICQGRFLLNGEPIIFGENGELLDGMHRCYAIYQANRPVQTMVARGIAPEAFKTINTGKPRSFSDMLKINNGTGGKWQLPRLAAVIASMATNGGSMANVNATMSDMMEARRRYSFPIDSFSSDSSVIGSWKIVPSFVIGGVFASIVIDHKTLPHAKVFLEYLSTGAIDDPKRGGSSAVTLRNFILTTPVSGSGRRMEMYRKAQRAFKAFLTGEIYTKLYAPQRPVWDVSVGSEWWEAQGQ